MNINIRTDDRTVILGKTGSGKTVLEMHLLDQIERNTQLPILIHDIKSDLVLPKYIIARNPNELDIALDKYRLIHYIPTDLEVDDFNEVCHLVYLKGNVLFVIDEVSYYTTALGIEKWHRELIVRGRTRGIGIIHLSQRPRFIYNAIISETNHLFSFQLLLDSDIDKIRPIISKEFCDRVPILDKYWFIYADCNRKVQICKPLPFKE